MFDISVAGLLHAAGQHPAIQAGAIVLGTFILEDAATVLAAIQVQADTISLGLALASLYVGIVLGDLGLYGLGRLAALFPWAHRWVPRQRQYSGRRWIETHVFKVVFISRFMPGARLPTYTACGFLGVNPGRFALAAILATLVWTSLLFGVSLHVGKLLMEHLGVWRWAGALGFAVVIVVIGRVAARLQADPGQ
jgi:membrane protein DedA with SNARE-associated domain